MLLSEILQFKGFNIDNTRIARHKVSNKAHVKELRNLNLFDLYQATQQKPIFGKATQFVSCTDLGTNKALLYGVYKIKEVKTIQDLPPELECIRIPEFWTTPPFYSYDIEEISIIDDLKERLVINWGEGTRTWCQLSLDKEIIEILPKGFFKPFPGYQEVILSFDELSKVINNPTANRNWQMMLSNVFGIYLILDKVSGKQYIGSAYGKLGIWGRWSQYIETKHGGNKALVELLSNEPERYRDFQFSILSVLPNSVLKDDITRLEAITKQKLGSLTFGLNEN